MDFQDINIHTVAPSPNKLPLCMGKTVHVCLPKDN